MVTVLKTVVPQGTVGSNPTPSASFVCYCKVKRWLLEEGFLGSRGWIRQKFLHLANGIKNIGKRIEGKQGLSGVIRFKGYGKWIEPPVTMKGQVAQWV